MNNKTIGIILIVMSFLVYGTYLWLGVEHSELGGGWGVGAFIFCLVVFAVCLVVFAAGMHFISPEKPTKR